MKLLLQLSVLLVGSDTGRVQAGFVDVARDHH